MLIDTGFAGFLRLNERFPLHKPSGYALLLLVNKTNTTSNASPATLGHTYRVTYFSGNSRKIAASNYDEAVLLAHRGRHNSCVADIEEIAP